MIYAFVGTPGSGKSYEAVLKVLETIKLGRKVYTNIEGLDDPVCKEFIKMYCNITDFQLETCLNHLTNEQSKYFWWHIEPKSLVIIDEVHKLFSNRDWADEKNREFTEWSSTHRHTGNDLILITQDIEKVDKHARSLIEWSFLYRKINFMGDAVQKKYIKYIYPGDNHKGQPQQKSVMTYDTDVFKCYKSYDADDIQETALIRTNIFKQPVFYAVPVAFIITAILFSRANFFNDYLVSPAEAMSDTEQAIAEEKTFKEKALSLTKVEIPNQQEVVPHPTPEELEAKQKQKKSEIIAYQKQDGKIIWTNNGIVPSNSRFLRKL